MAIWTLLTAALRAVPSFHLVLSDGNLPLKGETKRVAENVMKSFEKIEIEVLVDRSG